MANTLLEDYHAVSIGTASPLTADVTALLKNNVQNQSVFGGAQGLPVMGLALLGARNNVTPASQSLESSVSFVFALNLPDQTPAGLALDDIRIGFVNSTFTGNGANPVQLSLTISGDVISRKLRKLAGQIGMERT